MAAACLLLLVMVVICCLLWRNAKRYDNKLRRSEVEIVISTPNFIFRQSKDHYYAESLHGGDADNLHHLSSDLLARPIDTVDPKVDLSGSLHQLNQPLVNGSIQQTMPPATPILATNGYNTLGSQATTVPLGSSIPLQPLPQHVPAPTVYKPHPMHRSHQNVQSVHNTSDDSLPSALSLQVPIMDPRVPQPRLQPKVLQTMPSPTSGRKNYVDNSTTDWSDSAMQQPMGLPKTHGKLVPGRMNDGSGNNTPQMNRANSQNNFRKEISSTAV